jgi:hypothetical protein
MDSVLSAADTGNVSTNSGYTFTYVPGTAVTTAGPGCAALGVNFYAIITLPITVGTTGQRGFFCHASGVIRFTTDGTAPTAAGSPLQ